MSLSIGDATLTFLGDITQLDQVFAEIPAKTEASMAAATGSVGQLGTAVQGINFELDATASNAPYAGGQIKEAMDVAGESTAQARGEIVLIGDLIGVKLPRHIVSFLAELPGVGSLLSAAFAATAVVFLVDMVAKAIDKHEQMAKALEKSALATENVTIKERDHTASLELSNLKLDDQIAKLEGRPDKNRLQEALLETGKAADELATAFGKDFEQVDEAIIKTTSFFGRFSQDLHSLWTLLNANPEAFAGAWHQVISGTKDVETALTGVQKQVIAINKLRAEPVGKNEEDQVAQAQALAKAYETLSTKTKDAMKVVETQAPHNTELIEKLSGAVVSATAAQTDFGLQAENVHKRVQLAADETAEAERRAWEKAAAEADKAFEHQAKEAEKEAAWEEKIRTEARNQAIATLEQTEKEKLAATRAGSDARLAVINAAMKEEESKGLQDTSFYKSLQTERVKFVQDREDAEFKVINTAAAAKLKLEEKSATTELAVISETYSQQEKAVTELASFKYISAAQASKRLELLYTEENAKQLSVLKTLLKHEEDAIKEAQNKLSAAQNNPFMSPQQIAELQKLLDQAVQAEETTKTKLANTNKAFRDKELTLDKGYYGQALALAVAGGNQLLAEQLRNNHGALLAAEIKLKEAKARGLNTTAIDKEIQELKKLDKQLEDDAHRVGAVSMALTTFKDTMKAAYTEEVGAFATATAAMITGQESFGKAMEAATFSMIGKMAQKWAEYCMAQAAFAYAGQDYVQAGEYTAAAVLFEVLSGVMSGLSSNASKSGGAAKSGPTTINTTGTTATNTPAAAPAQGMNIPHLEGGGLITAPTLAMLGEGNRREAVLPLNDSNAMRMIGEAIAQHLNNNNSGSGGGGGDTIFNIKGMVSSDTVGKLMRKITHQVNTGRGRMTGTNTHKITRRA
jgi:hypothetical protein